MSQNLQGDKGSTQDGSGNQNEKRRYPRSERRVGILFSIEGEQYWATTADVSQTGALLHSAVCPPVGTNLLVRLIDRNDPLNLLYLRTKVVRHAQDKLGARYFAVEFEDAVSRDLLLLRSFIETVLGISTGIVQVIPSGFSDERAYAFSFAPVQAEGAERLRALQSALFQTMEEIEEAEQILSRFGTDEGGKPLTPKGPVKTQPIPDYELTFKAPPGGAVGKVPSQLSPDELADTQPGSVDGNWKPKRKGQSEAARSENRAKKDDPHQLGADDHRRLPEYDGRPPSLLRTDDGTSTTARMSRRKKRQAKKMEQAAALVPPPLPPAGGRVGTESKGTPGAATVLASPGVPPSSPRGKTALPPAQSAPSVTIQASIGTGAPGVNSQGSDTAASPPPSLSLPRSEWDEPPRKAPPSSPVKSLFGWVKGILRTDGDGRSQASNPAQGDETSEEPQLFLTYKLGKNRHRAKVVGMYNGGLKCETEKTLPPLYGSIDMTILSSPSNKVGQITLRGDVTLARQVGRFGGIFEVSFALSNDKKNLKLYRDLKAQNQK